MKQLILCFGLILAFPSINAHSAKDAVISTYEEIKLSTDSLDKEWNSIRKEYAKKFKIQLNRLNQEIDITNIELDHGNLEKRKEINKRLIELKEARDATRQLIHQITATSIVKLSGIQKHFINAKDDTKD